MNEWIANTLIDWGISLYTGGFWFVNKAITFTVTILQAPSIATTWSNVRGFSLTLFSIAILAIAAMNILKIDIQTWGVNRLIPKLFLAVFAVLFSKFICFSIINFSHALAGSILDFMQVNLLNDFNKLGDDFAKLKNQGIGVGPAMLIFFMGLLCVVTLLILAIVLFVRAALLAFLIIISPFAFAMIALPWSEKYTGDWMKEFIKWTFFFPVCLLILAVGVKLASETILAGGAIGTNNVFTSTQSAVDAGSLGLPGTGVSFMQRFGPMIIAFIAIPLSVYFPLKMLGAVGAAAQGMMKRAGKGAAMKMSGANRAKAAWKNRADRKANNRKNKPSFFGDNAFGRFASGRSADDVAKRNEDLRKRAGNLSSEARDHLAQTGTWRGYRGADRAQLKKLVRDSKRGRMGLTARGRRNAAAGHALDAMHENKNLTHNSMDTERAQVHFGGGYQSAARGSNLHHLSEDHLNNLTEKQLSNTSTDTIDRMADHQFTGTNQDHLDSIYSSKSVKGNVKGAIWGRNP